MKREMHEKIIGVDKTQYNGSLSETYHGEVVAVGDDKRIKNGYLGIQEGFEAELHI